MRIKGVTSFVTPFEGNHIPREFGNQPWVAHQNIPPKLHRIPSGFQIMINLQQEIQVHSSLTNLLDMLRALSLAKIESLIAADVNLIAAEVWQEIIVKFSH